MINNIAHKVETVAIAAYNCKGELLFGLRNDTSTYTMPGGHINPGEQPVQAAVRELREETGLTALSLEPLGTEEVRPGVTVHAFTAIVEGEPTGAHDPDQECQSWEFFPVEHGLPQGLINNLQHPKNVVLRLLGLLDPYQTPADPDDIDALMGHCDPFERSMALKMDGILPRHLMSAFSSDNSDLHEQALDHDAMSPEVLSHLMRLPDRHDIQQKALDHKLCNQVQVVRLLGNLKQQIKENPNTASANTLLAHLINSYVFDDQTVNNMAIDNSMPVLLRALCYRLPNINNDLLSAALADPNVDEELRLAAIKNTKVPSDYLISLLKNPNEKNSVALAAASSPRLTTEDLDQLVFHSDLRGYHPQLKQFALMNPHIQERHVNHIQNLSYKAVDTDPAFDNQLNKFLAKNCSDDVLADLLGVDAKLDKLMQAAKFLCSHDPVMDIRTALFQNDGDLVGAVLCAYGMPVTDANRLGLLAVQELRSMEKAEAPDFFQQEVYAEVPEATAVAKELQEAFASKNYESIELNGKHIKGAFLVHISGGQDVLLKPNSGKLSPAIGIDEEKATEAQREACFYHIAKDWGLEQYVPETQLIKVVEKEYAAIEMMPSDYMNLDVKRKAGASAVEEFLFPYVNSGMIWLWAILDFTAANADRHANNILVNDTEIKLIDHGSAFASLNFAPGRDENTFIPYYLRYGCVKGFNSLSQEDKLKVVPRASKTISEEIKTWILSLDLLSLQEILERYEINPTPPVARLAALQHLCQTMAIDEALASLWCGALTISFE